MNEGTLTMYDANKLIVRLMFVILLIVNLAAGLPSAAQSRPSGARKISSGLVQRVRGAGGDSRVKVVVQFTEIPAPLIDGLLSRYTANVTGRLSALNMRVIEIPLRAVEALALQKEVRYLSADRPIATLGHIETTTGTTAARQQTSALPGGIVTATNVFDGSGIAIAIVDSGIDITHSAFRDQNGSSRVILSRDFTGENRTDDPYGHGTHVASIAAGNGQIFEGAYTGIAPNANLLNLRILDSQGAGTTSSLLAALDWIMTYRAVYNLRVVNMSIGTPAIDSFRNDPLCQAVRRVTDAGIVVIAAAGNNGKDSSGAKIYGQIHSPGNEPSAITVGAANAFGTDERADDTVTSYSSRGPTRS